MNFQNLRQRLDEVFPEPGKLTRADFQTSHEISVLSMETIPEMIADAIFEILVQQKRSRQLPNDELQKHNYLLRIVEKGVDIVRAALIERLSAIRKDEHKEYQHLLSDLLDREEINIDGNDLSMPTEQFQKMIYMCLSQKFLDEFPV